MSASHPSPPKPTHSAMWAFSQQTEAFSWPRSAQNSQSASDHETTNGHLARMSVSETPNDAAEWSWWVRRRQINTFSKRQLLGASDRAINFRVGSKAFIYGTIQRYSRRTMASISDSFRSRRHERQSGGLHPPYGIHFAGRMRSASTRPGKHHCHRRYLPKHPPQSIVIRRPNHIVMLLQQCQ